MNAYKFTRNVLIVLAVSVLPFIAAELFLRLAYPDKVVKVTRPEPEVLAYEFNEDYLVSLKPNVTSTFVRSKENGGEVMVSETNSDSFRGPELASNPEFRIIVYGDSNIQARFSKYENTYVYKLGEYLRANGMDDVEVVNAGVVGFGPDQSLLRFEKEADIYKPDLVIFSIFPDNDFGDIIRNRLFELDANGNLIKTNHKRRIDKCLMTSADNTFGDHLSSLLVMRAMKKLTRLDKGNENEVILNVKNRVLSDKTLYILQNVRPEELNNLSDEELRNVTVKELERMVDEEYLIYQESKPQKFSHCNDHYDIDIGLDPDKGSSKAKLKIMDAVIKRAKNVADSKDISFMVVIQPSVIDMTTDNGDVLGYQYLQKYPKYRRTNLTNAIKDICVRNNIPYIDFFDVFIRNNPGDLYFRKDNNHWNDKGQDIAAGETASYIRTQMISN